MKHALTPKQIAAMDAAAAKRSPIRGLVGYARVSTDDQSLAIQMEQLKAAGCSKIYAETYTGTTAKGREQLEACLASLKEGEVLVVVRLDRLARSMPDLTSIVADLVERKVGFRCIAQAAIDTTTLTGRLLLNIMGSFAEFEAQLIKERQRAGIDRAKKAGVYKGGKVRIDYDAARRMRLDGRSHAEIAGTLRISQASAYRITKGL